MQKPRQGHTAPNADQPSLKGRLRQLEEQLAFFVGKAKHLEADNKALRGENVFLRKEQRQLHGDYQALLADYRRLRGQLSQNSRNSHQPPSEGTLNNLQARCHKALEPAERQIKAALGRQAVVHFDETGLDKKRWLHTATNERLTCFHVNFLTNA